METRVLKNRTHVRRKKSFYLCAGRLMRFLVRCTSYSRRANSETQYLHKVPIPFVRSNPCTRLLRSRSVGSRYVLPVFPFLTLLPLTATVPILTRPPYPRTSTTPEKPLPSTVTPPTVHSRHSTQRVSCTRGQDSSSSNPTDFFPPVFSPVWS